MRTTYLWMTRLGCILLLYLLSIWGDGFSFLVSEKILTADNLAIRQLTHNPICQLYRIHPETTLHNCHDCSFFREVWDLIQSWSGTTLTPTRPGPPASITAFWDDLIRGLPKRDKRELSGRLMYTWWGVWKERNRRIFRSTATRALQVALLVWEEYQGRILGVCSGPGRLASLLPPSPPPPFRWDQPLIPSMYSSSS